MKQSKKRHVRRSLVVSPVSIKQLQRLLNVGSESEAAQIAAEDRLLAEKLAATADRIAKRGGLVDAFERSGSSRRKRFNADHRRVSG